MEAHYLPGSCGSRRPDSTSYGRQQHGKRAHALRAVDQHAFDVRRRGRAGVEDSIVHCRGTRAGIGVVEIDDDVGGIEQHDQVLREIGDRIDPEVAVGQQHRAGLGDGERRAHDGEVDIRQIAGVVDVGDIAIAL